MMNQTNLRLQIENAFNKEDFSEANNIFIAGTFSFTDYLVFVKKHKLFSREKFWISSLPHFKLQEVLESELKIDFFDSYFSKSSNCNHELNNHLLVIAKDDYVFHFKLSQAFKMLVFLNSFKEIAKRDAELEKKSKEFSIIVQALKKIEQEQSQDNQFLLQFDLGEITMAFTLYYYQFKQSPEILGNKALQTSIEVTLVDELNDIMRLFKDKPNMKFSYQSNEDVQKEYQRYEAPHKFRGKEGIFLPLAQKYQFIYQIINRLIKRKSQRGLIGLYSSGYADFKANFLNPATLKTNEKYRQFRINNNKSTVEECYFCAQSIKDIFELARSSNDANFISNNIIEKNISGSIKMLDIYGISAKIQTPSKSISLEKVFRLLKIFSTYKGQAKRTMGVIENEANATFINLFGKNESISFFEYDILIQNLSTYFKWDKSETENILSFLTFDITSKEQPISWISSPFLKYNNKVLWLGSFLIDRRWDNIISNKLKVGKLEKIFSDNFEKQIAKLFESKGFKTIHSLKFQSSNGQSGDFDTLAYKDKYLFVCEAKTSKRTDDFSHAAYMETVRLEGCAAEQIEKSLHNIQENWESIKSKLQIEESITFEEIKVISLIITDYFEGDLRLYKNNYNKISFLELDVILNNNKKELFEKYIDTIKHLNAKNSNLNLNYQKSENWHLWGDNKHLEMATIVSNIQNNSIWNEMSKIWNFKDEEVPLNY